MNKWYKVIFVDIDGPLSYDLCYGKIKVTDSLNLPYQWDQEECDALAEIIRRTDAKVVISSDWKKYFSKEQLGQFFEFYGIPNTIIGVTHDQKAKLSSDRTYDRAKQIADWVNDHVDEIETWVAIDDMEIGSKFEDMTEDYPHITKNNHVWLIGDWSNTTERLRDNVEKIIEILNGKTS